MAAAPLVIRLGLADVYAILLLNHKWSSIFRSSLTDVLVDWNTRVSISVRPYVHKKFFRFPSNFVCG